MGKKVNYTRKLDGVSHKLIKQWYTKRNTVYPKCLTKVYAAPLRLSTTVLEVRKS